MKDACDLLAAQDFDLRPWSRDETGPGVIAAVLARNKVTSWTSIGRARIGPEADHLTPKTVFYIASVSKQFTAACVTACEADGLIDIDASIREYQARRGGVLERRAAGAATVRLADANIAKLEQTIPLASRQREAYETLAAKGYSSKLRLIQEQERAVALRQELRAEQARRDEALAQVASLNRELAQIAEGFAGQAALERAEAEAIVATRGAAVRKTDQRQALQTLTAPVSGIVQEVSVTTLGQVAEVGQTLITIVPDGERLVLEGLVLNKDISALRADAAVAVKLEAYPFTRYGTLKGVLEHVSPDAVVDEKRGLVFPARIRLTGVGDATNSRTMRLSPGMAATAEIVTGRRRVIDYLWSPIAKSVSEAGREP
ncbi:HlyD family type I secretion periplasmic adaptor subunit [Phenylobacterium sp.]|uniref:HlyD family type I secretion periplasmic adaptor subunit n=1 Tax=Phenylobacterium sp. TaxID=1871053 RepID=UPI002736A6E8|nr:HlyD family type I secretion periplasmic adaptor subunit [Phenylobacterium sp.]